ncbi:hypothetical protein HK104_007481 [Borealophlyctis nickersoniae]|nr:hypothetical protein HK104_007481 [Borealophlyctis nickersoniae]
MAARVSMVGHVQKDQQRHDQPARRVVRVIPRVVEETAFEDPFVAEPVWRGGDDERPGPCQEDEDEGGPGFEAGLADDDEVAFDAEEAEGG